MTMTTKKRETISRKGKKATLKKPTLKDLEIKGRGKDIKAGGILFPPEYTRWKPGAN